MITTTVRFDTDTFDRVKLHADRLGVAKAALIRDATILHLASMEVRDGHLREQVAHVIAGYGRRLDRVETWIFGGGR
jgi:predicted DNA-binding protein